MSKTKKKVSKEKAELKHLEEALRNNRADVPPHRLKMHVDYSQWRGIDGTGHPIKFPADPAPLTIEIR